MATAQPVRGLTINVAVTDITAGARPRPLTAMSSPRRLHVRPECSGRLLEARQAGRMVRLAGDGPGLANVHDPHQQVVYCASSAPASRGPARSCGHSSVANPGTTLAVRPWRSGTSNVCTIPP